MTVDDRRSARFRNQTKSPDGAPQPPGPGHASPDRLRVGHALAQLCAEHRAVICRSYYLGWTTAQIAADLGITDATVKSRLHDSLRALRQTLQQADGHRRAANRRLASQFDAHARSPGSMLLDDNTA